MSSHLVHVQNSMNIRPDSSPTWKDIAYAHFSFCYYSAYARSYSIVYFFFSKFPSMKFVGTFGYVSRVKYRVRNVCHTKTHYLAKFNHLYILKVKHKGSYSYLCMFQFLIYPSLRGLTYNYHSSSILFNRNGYLAE